MKQYHDLLRYILDHGVQKSDRTGTGTKSIFGYQMKFDLADWFPLLTTKKVYIKGIIHELLRFLTGSTNIRPLVLNDVNIRNERPFQHRLRETKQEQHFARYSDERKAKLDEFKALIKTDEAFAAQWGELGPVYGKQRRDFDGVDQISEVIHTLKTNPDSRRMIVSARNVREVEIMAKAWLPPCHTLFQLYVADGKLSCQLYQRSADVFLGVPFNIASYALLTRMMAQVCNLQPGTFVHTFGDAHIYNNHFDQVHEQLSRTPRPLPTMHLNPAVKDIFSFTYDDFTLEGYDPWPAIKASVAV